MLRRAGTHPNLVDRLAAAGARPAWRRPEPPPALAPTLLVLPALAGGLFAAAWRGFRDEVHDPPDRRRGRTLRHPSTVVRFVALFGYQLEGAIDAAPLDPESIPLLRFKRSLLSRWKFWRGAT